MSKILLSAAKWKKDQLLQPSISKSDAIRILLLQHIRGREISPPLAKSPDDVHVLADALAEVSSGKEEVQINMGLGGAPLRMLIGILALTPGHRWIIDAEDGLRRRPHGDLFAALKQLEAYGAKLETSQWPMVIDNLNLKLPDHLDFSINPSSSQFVSALAFGAAKAISAGNCHSVKVAFSHQLISPGYLDMTSQRLKQAGFDVSVSAGGMEIKSFIKSDWHPTYPLDWSAAGYLLVWSWISGTPVQMPQRIHPDKAIVEILVDAGLKITTVASETNVNGDLSNGLNGDAALHPDLIPTLAALALAAPSESKFANVSLLKGKESDRLQFIIDLVDQAGGSSELQNDLLTIKPPRQISSSISIETKEDHRRAMAGALMAGLGAEQVSIDDSSVVTKSFPGYWDELRKTGLRIEMEKR